MIKYYAIPCQNEVGVYIEEGEHNNFPASIFYAYSRCCLTTGFKSKEEAEEWNKTHVCERRKKVKA